MRVMSMMTNSSDQRGPSLEALNGRAEAVRKARPAYRELLEFYLRVFRRQMEWRDRVTVRPEDVDADAARACFGKGTPLLECHDPGIDPASLIELWAEMKEVFRRGNDVLRNAIETIDEAETDGRLVSAAWLPELRPQRPELIADAARTIGVEVTILATLSRATTLPHWERVSQLWLPPGRTEAWKRFTCPLCGGPPVLAETRTARNGQDGLKPAVRRWMHCPFCASRWVVPSLDCPSCGSTAKGDAKYLFTKEEPELRIDFCRSCNHYIKTIDGDKIGDPIHVGIELLTAAHLDVLAREKNLLPLNRSK